MTVPTWGLLQKSQVDNETIEEAIARLILVHEEDETSHLGVGESLQSHKASEIIDHVINSIVADKIKDFAVSLKKLAGNVFCYLSFFESLDGYAVGGTAGYTITPKVGNVFLNTNLGICSVWIAVNSYSPSFSKNPVMQVRFRIPIALTDLAYYIHCGKVGPHGAVNGYIGWRIIGSKLYAVCNAEFTGYETAVEITGINVSVSHVYRFEKVSNDEVNFYIDEVLKTTITTNIAITDYTEASFYAYAKSLVEGKWAELELSHVIYLEQSP